MEATIGKKAPGFELFDTEKNKISLEKYKGKNVVLLFFPLAFTGTCTKELCSVRDNLPVYNDLNAEVLAISVDSLFTLGKFKGELGLNFTLLSDFNKETARLYGILYEEFVYGMRGVAKRSAFVIDGESVIRHREVMESAGDIPDFEKVRGVLEELEKATAS